MQNKIGYSLYESKYNNINRALELLDKIVNVDDYKKELQSIKEKVDNTFDINNPGDTMFDDICSKLDKMKESINDDYLEFYQMHVLTNQIDSEIEDNVKDINDIIGKSKLLIELLSVVEPYNRNDLRELVNNAYKTIYKVLVKEEIYDNSGLLRYILDKKNEVIEENIGRRVQNDIEVLNDKMTYGELDGINRDGLAYNYLTKDIFKKLSHYYYERYYVDKENERNNAVSELNNHLNDLKSEKKEIDTSKSKVKNLNIRMHKARAMFAAYVLIPVMIGGTGYFLGSKIQENKYTERTYDYSTKEVIEQKEDYQVGGNNRIDIEVTSPYEEKWFFGTTYQADYNEYAADNDVTIEEVLSDSIDDILENRARGTKSGYSKTDSIDKDNNERKIIVREKVIDKDDRRSCQGAAIAIGIGAFVISTLGIALFNDENSLYYNWNDKYYKLKNKKRSEYSRKDIKELESDLDKHITAVQKEYNDKSSKYGKMDSPVEDYYGDVKRYIKR